MITPNFIILTQKELTIDLSRPAMEFVIAALENGCDIIKGWTPALQCEIDNFRNTLQNLMERSEPKPENFDLVGG